MLELGKPALEEMDSGSGRSTNSPPHSPVPNNLAEGVRCPPGLRRKVLSWAVAHMSPMNVFAFILIPHLECLLPLFVWKSCVSFIYLPLFVSPNLWLRVFSFFGVGFRLNTLHPREWPITDQEIYSLHSSWSSRIRRISRWPGVPTLDSWVLVPIRDWLQRNFASQTHCNEGQIKGFVK